MKKLSTLCVAFLFASCVTVDWIDPGAGSEEDGATGNETRSMDAVEPPLASESLHSGFLLGSPAGITSNKNPAIVLKPAGFAETDPDITPPAGQPVFEQFLADIFTGASTESPILAMSLGIDVIDFLPKSFVKDEILDEKPLAAAMDAMELLPLPGLGGWVAIQFSVNGAETGVAELAPDIQAAKEVVPPVVDRTVFSYVLMGVPVLDDELESVSAMSPEALGLTAAGDEIHGLNMHMALYKTDLSGALAGAFTSRALPSKPTIYFTLRPEYFTATGTLPVWVVPAHASTAIYKSVWAALKWSTPEVYRSPAELGFDPLKPLPVIDGLAIDAADSTGEDGAQILFSDRTSPPADQIRYLLTKPPGEASGPPKRVVVKFGRGGDVLYGSLGVRLGAGSGVGDYCVKDPVSARSSTLSPTTVDDYFVARRLMPMTPAALPVRVHVPHAFDWNQPELPIDPSVLQGRPEPVPSSPLSPRHRPRVVDRPQQWIKHPHLGVLLPLPSLELAVAGYRQVVKRQPQMRTCMSWPESVAAEGRATVQWGHMNSLNDDHVTWYPAAENTTLTYHGKPLIADRPLPGATADRTNRVLVAQWTLVAGGKLYTSHISALRY